MNLEEATMNELIKYESVHILEEMSSPGPAYRGYRFFVYGGEGRYPHMHITKNGKTVCCPRLDCLDYWHKEKFKKCDSNLREILYEYMKMPYRNRKFHGTNWDYLVDAWNGNNTCHEMSEDLEMPDYSKIPIESK